MTTNIFINKITILSLFLTLLVASLVFIGGCTKTLDGAKIENQKPIVWFVNVPPENLTFSRNPIINWSYRDKDGSVDSCSYIVVTETEIGEFIGKGAGWNPLTEPLTQTEVDGFIDNHLTSDTSLNWITLVVDSDAGDPQSNDRVQMKADLESPVLVLVPQYIFLQAFDDKNLGSDIIYRRFLRNNNPPNTTIPSALGDILYINSVMENTSPAVGMRISWDGEDPIDYPADPPPFEYQWRLYGPYTDEDYDALIDSFVIQVFVTNDAQVFRFGVVDTVIVGTDTNYYPVAYVICDTTFDSGIEVINCDSLIIDTITVDNIYGSLQLLLRVDDPDFVSSSFDRVAVGIPEDEWTYSTNDSMFNVFSNQPSDTTQQGAFLFWVRSRDDALVPDLTPAFLRLNSVDPKYERDIGVFELARGAPFGNKLMYNDMRDYFSTKVTNWVDSRDPSDSIYFDPERDILISNYPIGFPANLELRYWLKFFLGYKVLVFVSDDTRSGIWGVQGSNFVQASYIAMNSGVNVWLMGRALMGVTSYLGSDEDIAIPNYYRFYFGLEMMRYSGWYNIAGTDRFEDFIGGVSIDPDRWPDLDIDTTNLHSRYMWIGNATWDPDIAALPEVNWCIRTPDTELQYLYRSSYGSMHPKGFEFSYDGHPAAHRLNRGAFQTIHWMFTPVGMDDVQGQTIINSNLDWLYDNWQARFGE